MTRLVLTFASLVAVLVPATPAGAGACAVRQASPTPATPKDAVIEDGGGVIIAAGFGAEAPSNGDVVTQAAWRFRDGRKLVAPTIDKIAPGLAVYRLPASRSQTYVLENDKHKEVVSVRRSTDRDASVLPAPMPTSADQTVFSSPRDRGDFVTVHLIAPAPRGAAMMVAYGPDGQARSYGAVAANAKDVTVYRSRGRCALEIPGEIATHGGESITVAWLDASGRLSAKSKPVEVAPGAP